MLFLLFQRRLLLRSATLFLCVMSALWLPAASVATAATAVPTAPLVLAPGVHDYPLAAAMDMLEDTTAMLDIAAVSSGLYAERFRPVGTQGTNYGFRRSALWFRVQIDFRAVAEHQWHLLEANPAIDQLTIYMPGAQDSLAEKSGWVKVVMGDALPFAARPYALREFVLPLPYRLTAGNVQPTTFFVRIAGNGALHTDLRVASTQGLAGRTSEQQWGFGLFYGALLVMFLYNLFLYLSTREQTQFFYILFLGGFTLLFFNLNGFGLQYLWPDFPRINGWFPAFTCIAMWGALQFTRSFLDLRHGHPLWMDAAFRWMSTAVVAVFFLSLLLPRQWAYMLGTGLPVFFGLIMFAVGIVRLRQGYRPARLFVAGWGVLLAGAVLLPMANFGILPINAFTKYSPHLGAVMQAVLLSLALGDRMKFLRMESERIEQESHHKLEQMFAQLQHLDADKLRFLQYLSHELNTPLNWMSATRNVDAEKISPELRGMLDAVESGQQRMIDLVGVVMRYFDLAGEDPATIPVAPVAPMWLVDELLRERASAVAEKKLTVHNRVPADLVVLANEQRLRRALGHLVDNAIDFSNTGQEIELLGGTEADGAQGVVTVRDHGRGIGSNEQINRLFDPFFMVGSRHRDGGFGLSLATAKLLTVHMGGDIRAHSAGNGQGAEFSVVLPRAR